MVNLELVALKVKCDRQYQTIVKLQDEKIDLFKENQQLKEVIEEATEELKLAYNELQPNELVNGRAIIKNILQILDKVKV